LNYVNFFIKIAVAKSLDFFSLKLIFNKYAKALDIFGEKCIIISKEQCRLRGSAKNRCIKNDRIPRYRAVILSFLK
jgi:hypothetical protein